MRARRQGSRNRRFWFTWIARTQAARCSSIGITIRRPGPAGEREFDDAGGLFTIDRARLSAAGHGEYNAVCNLCGQPVGSSTAGNLAEVTYDYTFDTAHLGERDDSLGNKQISYGYNRSGQPTAMIDSHRKRTDYRYDPVGRLTGIWAANGDVLAFSCDDEVYAYDPDAKANSEERCWSGDQLRLRWQQNYQSVRSDMESADA